jgi:hypothetical protein
MPSKKNVVSTKYYSLRIVSFFISLSGTLIFLGVLTFCLVINDSTPPKIDGFPNIPSWIFTAGIFCSGFLITLIYYAVAEIIRVILAMESHLRYLRQSREIEDGSE